ASTKAADPADLEFRLQSAHRAAAHEYPELPGLHDELHVPVVKAQLVGRELEVQRARFARLQGDPTESGQGADRPGHARHLVVHVQLDDFGTFARTGVSYGD